MFTWTSNFNKVNKFKNFVTEMYYRNVDERYTYNEKPKSFEEYVSENKWFLKERYKQETKSGNA
jgi:hypothetical protein